MQTEECTMVQQHHQNQNCQPQLVMQHTTTADDSSLLSFNNPTEEMNTNATHSRTVHCWRCPACTAPFTRIENLREHLKEHDVEFMQQQQQAVHCSNCLADLKQAVFRNISLSKDSKSQLTKCYASLTDLYEHIKMSHRVDEMTSLQMTCTSIAAEKICRIIVQGGIFNNSCRSISYSSRNSSAEMQQVAASSAAEAKTAEIKFENEVDQAGTELKIEEVKMDQNDNYNNDNGNNREQENVMALPQQQQSLNKVGTEFAVVQSNTEVCLGSTSTNADQSNKEVSNAASDSLPLPDLPALSSGSVAPSLPTTIDLVSPPPPQANPQTPAVPPALQVPFKKRMHNFSAASAASQQHQDQSLPQLENQQQTSSSSLLSLAEPPVVTSTAPSQTDGHFRCPACKLKQFNLISELEVHMEEHDHSAPSTGESFDHYLAVHCISCIGQLQQQQHISENTFIKLHWCYLTLMSLYRHIKADHPVGEAAILQMMCASLEAAKGGRRLSIKRKYEGSNVEGQKVAKVDALPAEKSTTAETLAETDEPVESFTFALSQIKMGQMDDTDDTDDDGNLHEPEYAMAQQEQSLHPISISTEISAVQSNTEVCSTSISTDHSTDEESNTASDSVPSPELPALSSGSLAPSLTTTIQPVLLLPPQSQHQNQSQPQLNQQSNCSSLVLNQPPVTSKRKSGIASRVSISSKKSRAKVADVQKSRTKTLNKVVEKVATSPAAAAATETETLETAETLAEAAADDDDTEDETDTETLTRDNVDELADGGPPQAPSSVLHFQCPACMKAFSEIEMIQKHFIEHDIATKLEQPVQCIDCTDWLKQLLADQHTTVTSSSESKLAKHYYYLKSLYMHIKKSHFTDEKAILEKMRTSIEAAQRGRQSGITRRVSISSEKSSAKDMQKSQTKTLNKVVKKVATLPAAAAATETETLETAETLAEAAADDDDTEDETDTETVTRDDGEKVAELKIEEVSNAASDSVPLSELPALSSGSVAPSLQTNIETAAALPQAPPAPATLQQALQLPQPQNQSQHQTDSSSLLSLAKSPVVVTSTAPSQTDRYFRCPACMKPFTLISQLEEHLAEHDAESGQHQPPMQCINCTGQLQAIADHYISNMTLSKLSHSYYTLMTLYTHIKKDHRTDEMATFQMMRASIGATKIGRIPSISYSKGNSSAEKQEVAPVVAATAETKTAETLTQDEGEKVAELENEVLQMDQNDDYDNGNHREPECAMAQPQQQQSVNIENTGLPAVQSNTEVCLSSTSNTNTDQSNEEVSNAASNSVPSPELPALSSGSVTPSLPSLTIEPAAALPQTPSTSATLQPALLRLLQSPPQNQSQLQLNQQTTTTITTASSSPLSTYKPTVTTNLPFNFPATAASQQLQPQCLPQLQNQQQTGSSSLLFCSKFPVVVTGTASSQTDRYFHCPACFMAFFRATDLQNHLAEQDAKIGQKALFQCISCIDHLQQQQSADQHISNNSTLGNLFQSNYTLMSLYMHIQIHHLANKMASFQMMRASIAATKVGRIPIIFSNSNGGSSAQKPEVAQMVAAARKAKTIETVQSEVLDQYKAKGPMAAQQLAPNSSQNQLKLKPQLNLNLQKISSTTPGSSFHSTLKPTVTITKSACCYHCPACMKPFTLIRRLKEHLTEHDAENAQHKPEIQCISCTSLLGKAPDPRKLARPYSSLTILYDHVKASHHITEESAILQLMRACIEATQSDRNLSTGNRQGSHNNGDGDHREPECVMELQLQQQQSLNPISTGVAAVESNTKVCESSTRLTCTDQSNDQTINAAASDSLPYQKLPSFLPRSVVAPSLTTTIELVAVPPQASFSTPATLQQALLVPPQSQHQNQSQLQLNQQSNCSSLSLNQPPMTSKRPSITLRYQCPACGIKFSKIKMMREHLFNHDNVTMHRPLAVQCFDCIRRLRQAADQVDRSTTSKLTEWHSLWSLYRHIKNDHHPREMVILKRMRISIDAAKNDTTEIVSISSSKRSSAKVEAEVEKSDNITLNNVVKNVTESPATATEIETALETAETLAEAAAAADDDSEDESDTEIVQIKDEDDYDEADNKRKIGEKKAEKTRIDAPVFIVPKEMNWTTHQVITFKPYYILPQQQQQQMNSNSNNNSKDNSDQSGFVVVPASTVGLEIDDILLTKRYIVKS